MQEIKISRNTVIWIIKRILLRSQVSASTRLSSFGLVGLEQEEYVARAFLRRRLGRPSIARTSQAKLELVSLEHENSFKQLVLISSLRRGNVDVARLLARICFVRAFLLFAVSLVDRELSLGKVDFVPLHVLCIPV